MAGALARYPVVQMDFCLFSLGESPKNVASTVLIFKMSDTMLAIEPHSVTSGSDACLLGGLGGKKITNRLCKNDQISMYITEVPLTSFKKM